ncbi:MAG: hypothetical protein JO208_11175 [Alphaproteobacteria bacterium]|nr:hypothetical protein [Alphaproteobacteria bacterium]
MAARIVPLPWDRWPENADGLALLVNATSAGMVGFEPLGLSLKHLARTASVYDVVYNPTETDLLRQARSRGNRAANGLGMLIHQAAPSFEAFYGIRPPVTSELRETMQRSLAH